jgi:hypothetical protein
MCPSVHVVYFFLQGMLTPIILRTRSHLLILSSPMSSKPVSTRVSTTRCRVAGEGSDTGGTGGKHACKVRFPRQCDCKASGVGGKVARGAALFLKNGDFSVNYCLIQIGATFREGSVFFWLPFILRLNNCWTQHHLDSTSHHHHSETAPLTTTTARQHLPRPPQRDSTSHHHHLHRPTAKYSACGRQR